MVLFKVYEKLNNEIHILDSGASIKSNGSIEFFLFFVSRALPLFRNVYIENK
jgi:hypothetical protein